MSTFKVICTTIEIINNKARHNLINAKCRWRSDRLDGTGSFREPLGQMKVMQIHQGETLNHQGITHKFCCLAAQCSNNDLTEKHGSILVYYCTYSTANLNHISGSDQNRCGTSGRILFNTWSNLESVAISHQKVRAETPILNGIYFEKNTHRWCQKIVVLQAVS